MTNINSLFSFSTGFQKIVYRILLEKDHYGISQLGSLGLQTDSATGKSNVCSNTWLIVGLKHTNISNSVLASILEGGKTTLLTYEQYCKTEKYRREKLWGI